MKEKDFQTKFTNWIKDNPQETTVFELKIEKGKSFAFNKVQDHQLMALKRAKHGNFYHKITDNPIFAGKQTRFHHPKPFDCFAISKGNAFIVIWFYKPRQKKEMLWIDVDTFLECKLTYESQGRKSLKEYEWAEFADRTVGFK